MSNLTWIFLILFAIQKIVQLWLNSRQLKSVVTNINTIAPHLQDIMTIEQHQKASHYNIERLKLGQYLIIVSIFAFAIFFPMGGINVIQSYILSLSIPVLAQFLIFMMSISFIEDLLHLPFEIYQTFKLDKKYGLSNMTVKLFITDKLKSMMMGIILLTLIAWVFLKTIELSQNWWFYFWLVFIGIQLTMLYLYPVLIAPLFNKFSPIENIELKEKLNQLASDVDFPLNDIQVMNASLRSNQSNAYFTGFGKKKKIVLFDTLLNQLSINQLHAVLAHELGHFKLKHITKSIITIFALSFIAFYLLGVLYTEPSFYTTHFVTEMTPYSAIYLFTKVLGVYLFPLAPIASYLSRKKEFEADAFAKKYSHEDDLIGALKTLSKENLSVSFPDRIYALFYYSHPPIVERIQKLKS